MSVTSAKRKSASARLPDLDRQIAEAKAILRQLRDTLEELDDRRELARAKKKNAGKPGTNWPAVRKELGLEF
jgi:chromosome segregation ATPase